jgi:hypothetical protein
VRDVLTRDAAGVERPHRQLRAGLTDRLRRDDADRFAEVGDLASREHAAVATRTDAGNRLARQHRTGSQARHRRVVGEQPHHVVVDFGVARDHRAVGQRRVLQQAAAEQARLEDPP